MGVVALTLVGCGGSDQKTYSSDEVTKTFEAQGIALAAVPSPFPTNGQEVLSPEGDTSFAPYQVWILRSIEEAQKYRAMFESGAYDHMVNDNPEYRVERTSLNGNVLLVIFRGSADGDAASSAVDALGR